MTKIRFNQLPLRIHELQKAFKGGGREIEIPVWFRQAIQRRWVDVVAQAEVEPGLSQLRIEEEEAFETLYATLSDKGLPRLMAPGRRSTIAMKPLCRSCYTSGVFRTAWNWQWGC
ncbi:hypothetical protein [Paenibacillus sp. 1P07SE]|uniref:hypothetical protein n=1 Tax=Paenibacillus sp. 1P07SE TaxID=3132209 RepID=UPI0039A41FA9